MKHLTRQNGTHDLLEKYCNNTQHARQVQKLSLLLFDATYGILHDYSGKKRKLLEAGSLLHDIGRYIADEGHNKHSYELIMQEGIDGFEKEDVEIIANIARYHRGSMPQKSHKNYALLPDKRTRRKVKRLASFVRIADGLDRDKQALIENISCSFDNNANILAITLTPLSEEYTPDYKIFQNKKGLLEKAFKTKKLNRSLETQISEEIFIKLREEVSDEQ